VSLDKQVRPAPQFGLIEVRRGKEIVVEEGERYIDKSPSFLEHFKTYCTKTIYSEKNVVISLKEIQIECEKTM
jgi:hypothetical protein